MIATSTDKYLISENQNQGMDVEQALPSDPTPAFACSAFNDIKIRAAFVRKVFAIVCAQLLLTFSIVAIFTFVIVFFVIYLVLVCSSKAARKVPLNYFFLFVLTLAMSLMLGVMASFHNTFSVILAIGFTVAITFGMTLFSLQTKYDLTKRLYLPLLAGLMGLMFFGLFAIIFRSQIMFVLYAAIGAIIFSLSQISSASRKFIAFDIQLIVGGKRMELSEEDYVFGALMLYMDIVQLFMMLLYLIGIGQH